MQQDDDARLSRRNFIVATVGAAMASSPVAAAGRPESTPSASGLLLNWPPESAQPRRADEPVFLHRPTNVALDFHGDPAAAKLVVFSDGNHHMALEEALRAFLARHSDVVDIFYVTAPPRVPSELLERGRLHIGNLTLSTRPHAFISPPNVLQALAKKGLLETPRRFMRSRGNVLLVRKGNPKGIRGVADVARDGVRLFISNPKTESASYQVYAETLRRIAARQGVALEFLDEGRPLAGDKVIHGELIHHRELPQAIADGRADVAMVYYHLALRYTRIFPEHFDIVFVDGDLRTQDATPDNVISRYDIALVGDGGPWGPQLLDHMIGAEVARIYERHGLRRAEAA